MVQGRIFQKVLLYLPLHLQMDAKVKLLTLNQKELRFPFEQKIKASHLDDHDQASISQIFHPKYQKQKSHLDVEHNLLAILSKHVVIPLYPTWSEIYDLSPQVLYVILDSYKFLH
ncbi:Uncharacterised protein [Streptococcus pneumoniae]|nr:Uncharacterised protein [Streptococcus pneumoniae]